MSTTDTTTETATQADTATQATEATADPILGLARSCWRELETLHVVGYFAPEPRHAYRDLGLRARDGYFASRSAPMGPVPAPVVVATFYVFSPDAVNPAIPAAWSTASPAQVLEARHAGVSATLRRVLGKPAEVEGLDEALELARTACAGLTAPGRALYAGHASLDWPSDPLLGLWHAASLLREHRGDGHVAALLQAGLDPIEAMLTYGATSGMTPFLKATRGFPDADWDAGLARLQERGLADADGTLTPQGAELRAEVERRTGVQAEEGWRHLGVAGAHRLKALVAPIREKLVASDIFPPGLFSSR